MGFFDTIGKVVNPKNVLTGAGLVTLGPWGAAGGRALGEAAFGNDWEPWMADEEGGSSLGEIAGQGALGYGMGYMAPESIKGGGGFSKALGELGIIDSGAEAAQAAGAAPSGSGAAPAATSGAAEAAGGGMSTMEKALLAGQAAQGVGSTVSAVQQGKVAREQREMMEERRKRRERLARLLQPYLQEALGAVGSDLDAAG